MGSNSAALFSRRIWLARSRAFSNGSTLWRDNKRQLLRVENMEADFANLDNLPEFQFDDISSVAHQHLEQHREIRAYARVMAYDMPRLSKFAKDYKPPQAGEVLRFRYTTYMGEQHPAEAKVVVQFRTVDLGLTDDQVRKLALLAGPRFDPRTDVIKMSSDVYSEPAQNKRYLSDLVDTLIEEAKDEKDMFEDVTLDYRHIKVKTRLRFPDEWKRPQKNLQGALQTPLADQASPVETTSPQERANEKISADVLVPR